jgi:hypothetical protein
MKTDLLKTPCVLNMLIHAHQTMDNGQYNYTSSDARFLEP